MKKIGIFMLTALTIIGLTSSIEINHFDDSTKDKTVGTKIGNIAPELSFENPEGKLIKLSSLKGKIVLIDFWASWCRPCRMENPNIVRAYEKYSKAKFKTAKGFEVYSVSLDAKKQAWTKAIKQDKLSWKYHVSDLKQWRSEAAKLYGIRSIPTNYLIDEEGIIIAKSLRGQSLDIAIDKEVKGFK